MSNRKRVKYGTLVGATPELRAMWFNRDLEPELLSGEQVPDIASDDEPMRARDAKALLQRLLERCTKREEAVLVMRYMMDMSLQEVGTQLEVTRERVRQIEYKAMRKIRWKTVSDKDVRAFFR